MRIKQWIAPLVTAALIFSAVPANASDLVTSKYIVVLNHGVKATDLPFVEAQDIEKHWSAALNGYLLDLTDSEEQIIAADPRVQSVTYDAEIKLDSTVNNPSSNGFSSSTTSWALDRIDQRSKSLDGLYTYDSNQGQNIYAYVIDTGVEMSNKEFTGHIINGANFTSDAATNPYGNDTCNGHGTHVAGLLAGNTVGVASKTTIVPLRVVGCDGSGGLDSLISALNWIYAHHIDGSYGVINISLGWNETSSNLKEFGPVDLIIKNLQSKGVYSFVAAGNDNNPVVKLNGDTTMPAGLDSVITVGASDIKDNRAYFSNYGSSVDVFAPGDVVYSSVIGNTYGYMSGTSSASPIVAGIGARMLSSGAFTNFTDLKNAIVNNATPFAPANIGDGSPTKLAYISGDVSVAQNTYNAAYDADSTVKLYASGEGTTFTPQTTDTYSLTSDGTLTVKAQNGPVTLTIPVQASNGITSDTGNITYILRVRPTAVSRTINVTRDALPNLKDYATNLTGSGDGIQYYLGSMPDCYVEWESNQTCTYGNVNLSSNGSFVFSRTQDDSLKTWTQGINFFTMDQYGIKSKTATLTINMICGFSPDSYTSDFTIEMGKASELKSTFFCGTPVAFSPLNWPSGITVNSANVGTGYGSLNVTPTAVGTYNGWVSSYDSTFATQVVLNFKITVIPAKVVYKPLVDISASDVSVGNSTSVNLSSYNKMSDFKSISVISATNATYIINNGIITITPTGVGAVTLKYQGVYLDDTSSNIGTISLTSLALHDPVVDITNSSINVGGSVSINLGAYISLNEFKSFTVTSATNATYSIADGIVTITPNNVGPVSVSYQGTYLDDTLSNISTITLSALAIHKPVVDISAGSVNVGSTKDVLLGDYLNVSDFKSFKVYSITNGTYTISGSVISITPSTVGTVTVKYQAVYADDSTSNFGTITLKSLALHNLLVDISLPDVKIGNSTGVTLSYYLTLSEFKSFRVTSFTNATYSISNGVLTFTPISVGVVRLNYQGTYLDDVFSNIAKITTNGIPAFGIKLSAVKSTDTIVGKTLTYQLGYISQPSNISWLACSTQGVEVTSATVPFGCTVIASDTASLTLTQAEAGKYIRVGVKNGDSMDYSTASTLVYAPASPISKITFAISTTNMRFVWVKPDSNASVINGYRIEILSPKGMSLKKFILTSNYVSFVISAKSLKVTLKKGQKYTLKISVLSSAGGSAVKSVTAYVK